MPPAPNPAPKLDERCETCRFWLKRRDATQYAPSYGECRRYAPRGPLTIQIEGYTIWPETPLPGWCGEYQPKEPDNANG